MKEGVRVEQRVDRNVCVEWDVWLVVYSIWVGWLVIGRWQVVEVGWGSQLNLFSSFLSNLSFVGLGDDFEVGKLPSIRMGEQ